MRHIHIQGTPDRAWLAKAAGVQKALEDATTKAERDAIIDASGPVWTELKQWLLTHSHGKCWFSDTEDKFNHWHVEHFRPKKAVKKLDGTTIDGYWWLAVDWKNFRIIGSVGNSKKGILFPLRDESKRISKGGDIRYEDGVFLDPIESHDVSLISFNIEGDAIVSSGSSDNWDRFRAEYSIDKFNLNYGPLADKRKIVWSNCWSAAKEYLSELEIYHIDTTNMIAKAAFMKASRKLRDMIHEKEELCSVARACIVSSKDDRLLAVLQTS